MTILVTGGAGYIGSHVCLALLDAGRRVVVLDDLSTGFADAVHVQAKLVEGDVGDLRLVTELLREERVDAVIHLAAKTVVPDSVEDPAAYYASNTLNTAGLLRAMTDAGARRLIFSSTAAVYGETGSEPVMEDAPCRPLSPYGRSKLAAEWMIEDSGRAYGLSYAVLRYFNVAGADPRGRAGQSTAAATHLIKAACQTALGRRGPLCIYGEDFPTPDGTGVRDYVQVSDLATAHVSALEALEGGEHALKLNCGYGQGRSVREVIAAVERAADAKLPVEVLARRPGDVAVAVADAKRIREMLSWTPRHADLDMIVGQALAWERRLAS